MEQLKNAYTDKLWVKLMVLGGLLLNAVLLLILSGGFPPWTWRLLFYTLRQLGQLWATQRGAIVLPLLVLIAMAAGVFVLWVLLVVQIIKVAGDCRYDLSVQQRLTREIEEASLRAEQDIAEGRYDDDGYGDDVETMPEMHYVLPSQELAQVVGGPRRDVYGAGQAVQGVRGGRVAPQMYAPSADPSYSAAAIWEQPTRRGGGAPAVQTGMEQRDTRAEEGRNVAKSTALYPVRKRLRVVPPPREEELEDAFGEDEGNGNVAEWELPVGVQHDDIAEWTTRPRGDEELEQGDVTRLRCEQEVYTDSRESELEKTQPDPERMNQALRRTRSEAGQAATHLVVGIGLDPGIARKDDPNEDSLFAIQGMRITEEGSVPAGLFIVADGMGGHAHGREASRMAVRTMSDAIVPTLLRDVGPTSTEDERILFRDLLKDGVHRANLAIYQRNREQPQMMGTTVTAALVVHTTAYIINVGDSRTYHYRAGKGLKQVTRDHSLVADMVEEKHISAEDVYTHPLRNRINRCLGEHASVNMDSFTVQVRPGDMLLLCSDGLWEMVRDPVIERIVAAALRQPTQVSTNLVRAALRAGGADNISVIAVGIVEGED